MKCFSFFTSSLKYVIKGDDMFNMYSMGQQIPADLFS